ncbi:MAG: 4Fe-4S binding protein [Patescibacteria group bacterium]|nr:4Fe-4S binding protein [Patescibacteria group bacterium]
MLLLLCAGHALGVERFPPPDFTDHELPPTIVPDAAGVWTEYAALAGLTAAMTLAAYLALKRRSRRGLLALSVVALAVFGFWRDGCICPIGAIQNVVLAFGDASYPIPLVVAGIFVLPLVFALFYGRVFCAAVCPLGAVQELIALRPIRVPRWMDAALGTLAYVYLGLAVLLAATGTAFVICRYDPFVAFFRLSGSLNMLIVGACFLAIGLFVGRPYCRYLCPYGVLLGWCSRLSRWHVRIPGDQCIQCRLCEEACPYGAIREPTTPQSVDQRRTGRWRLAGFLVLTPVLVVAGFSIGRGLDFALARLHPTVRLAERLHQEDAGEVEGTVDMTDAYRATGRPRAELYAEAAQILASMRLGAGLLGAWVGLVIGGQLVAYSMRRRRTEYQPDRGACVACGRCFWYCPSGREGCVDVGAPT